MKFITLLFTAILIVSCKNEASQQLEGESKSVPLNLKYAQGFSTEDYDDYKVLNITKPWPKASKTFKYLIASNGQLAKMTFPKDEYDAVIPDSISKIVVTSTTHIPALELLGVESALIGFPETDYVSSKKTRKRINSGFNKFKKHLHSL